jgi:hypothetical protein
MVLVVRSGPWEASAAILPSQSYKSRELFPGAQQGYGAAGVRKKTLLRTPVCKPGLNEREVIARSYFTRERRR